MRTRDDIARALAEAGLAALTERVLAQVVDEVWLAAIPGDAAIGASRIGGAPDLPAGMPWPHHQHSREEVARWPEYARHELADAVAAGRVQAGPDTYVHALPFVAQLDLVALAPLQHALPRAGHLWLFADQTTITTPVDGTPSCASACLFEAGPAMLTRIVEPPPVPDGPLPSFALIAMAGIGLPPADVLGLTDDAWYRYDQAARQLEQEAPRHACLAPADHGSSGTIPPPGWVTLLRVDSDYRVMPPLNWGDAAWLTFALPAGALAAGRFDEVRAFPWTG